MKKENVTHKDIIKRLDKLEKTTEIISGSFLFYSIAVTLLVFSFAKEDPYYMGLGLLCYFSGAGLTLYNHFFVAKK